LLGRYVAAIAIDQFALSLNFMFGEALDVDVEGEGFVLEGADDLRTNLNSWLAQIIILVITAVSGALPHRASKIDAHWKWFVLSMANCFSGGVFLAAAFFHTLPEANEVFQEVCYLSVAL